MGSSPDGITPLVFRRYRVLPTVSRSYPRPRGRFPPIPLPFAAFLYCYILARLACLIHAANVHSEPGSNPSLVYAYINIGNKLQRLTVANYHVTDFGPSASHLMVRSGRLYTISFLQNLSQLKKLTFFHTRGHLPDYQRSVCRDANGRFRRFRFWRVENHS